MLLVWASIGGLGGLIAGSFIATLIVRWPAGRTLAGRSQCDACARPLRCFELIPLVSALIQSGKCRACSATISPIHSLVELTCAAVGVAAMLTAPEWQGAFGALFGWVLVALAILDLRHFWLPDRLTATLGVLGIAEGVAGFAPSLGDRAIGGVIGFLSLWSIGFAYRRWRGREGLGGGDPKLLGAIGLWLGWQPLPFVLLGGSLVGLVAIVGLRLARQRFDAATRIPLGALLALAAFPIWLLDR